MSRSRSLAILVSTVLAAVIAGLVLWRANRAEPESPAPSAVARPAARAPEPADPGPIRPLTPTRITARTHRPGARTAIPRLLPATTGRGFAEPPPASASASTSTNKKDAEIDRRLELAGKAASECLKSWAAIDPTAVPGVRLAFTLDAHGVSQVFLEDRADVPAGPLSCLSTAIYQQEWTGLTDQPRRITRTLKAEDPAKAARAR